MLKENYSPFCNKPCYFLVLLQSFCLQSLLSSTNYILSFACAFARPRPWTARSHIRPKNRTWPFMFARQNSAYKIFMCNPATSPVECNQQQQQQQHDEEEEKKEENWSISDNRQRCDDVGTTLNMLLSTHHQTSNRKSLYSYSAPLHSLLPCHFLK